MNIHQWQQQIRNFNKTFENTAPAKQWDDNTVANLPRFNKKNSIWQTDQLYTDDKALVLVGASPRLKEDVEKLKELDDNFITICANSSLKYLLKHDIKPDYVIAIDSDDIDIPQHLDIDRDDITLLASSVLCPKALDSWKGPIWYLPYFSINKKLRSKLRRRLGRSIPSGGNSMTEALVVATMIWGSHTVIFVANEYCFGKSYYADKEAAKQEKNSRLYPAIDINGDSRWTLPALYTYVIWTEKTCANLSPPGFFIDTSFGMLGKDRSVIHSMELSKAIQHVKDAFKIKDKLNELGNKPEIMRSVKENRNDKDKVFRYDMQEQQERLLRLTRD